MAKSYARRKFALSKVLTKRELEIVSLVLTERLHVMDAMLGLSRREYKEVEDKYLQQGLAIQLEAREQWEAITAEAREQWARIRRDNEKKYVLKLIECKER
jgi:hypothetical protein